MKLLRYGAPGLEKPGICPIGPWLVTKDEIADVQKLGMWLEVNGRRVQNGSTATMIFGAAYLVSYISQFMSLQPGDVISTDTPPGVGRRAGLQKRATLAAIMRSYPNA